MLSSAGAALAGPRPNIWDIPLGATVAELDADFVFVDYACGMAGAPPERRLDDFSDFAACRPETSGLREVAFRYDDEAELMSRALEQAQDILAKSGTTEFDFPIIPSLLIDASGHVQGKRLVTDPRSGSATKRPRHEFWTLGTLLRNRLAPSGWACEDLALAQGERAVGRDAVKSSCTLVRDDMAFSVQQLYLQQAGQAFVAPATARYNPDAFFSSTWIELLTPPAARAVAR